MSCHASRVGALKEERCDLLAIVAIAAFLSIIFSALGPLSHIFSRTLSPPYQSSRSFPFPISFFPSSSVTPDRLVPYLVFPILLFFLLATYTLFLPHFFVTTTHIPSLSLSSLPLYLYYVSPSLPLLLLQQLSSIRHHLSLTNHSDNRGRHQHWWCLVCCRHHFLYWDLQARNAESILEVEGRYAALVSLHLAPGTEQAQLLCRSHPYEVENCCTEDHSWKKTF